MKTISILFLLLVFGACSSHRESRAINDVSWDSLADESYMRWGVKRLEQFADPKMAVVNCYKGKTSETLGQLKKDYDKSGQDQYYWLHVGNCYFLDEVWTKAEFFYRMSLEESKSATVKSIALNNLGLIHFKYGQWDKGRDLLLESMKLAPKFRVPRYNISQLYLQFGHYDRAITVLSDRAFSGHKDLDVFFSLANAHLYKGDLKTAGQYFSYIPKEHFRREDIAATYALYLLKTGDTEGADRVMRERERSGVNEITVVSQKIERMVASRKKEELKK